MKHELKIWPRYFDEVASYRKRFELRKDDRRFEVGDELHLREWDPAPRDPEQRKPDAKGYTGRALFVRVIYVLRESEFGLSQGYAILGITDPADPFEGRADAGS